MLDVARTANVVPRVVERERERRHPLALLVGPEIAEVWWRVVHVDRRACPSRRGYSTPFRWPWPRARPETDPAEDLFALKLFASRARGLRAWCVSGSRPDPCAGSAKEQRTPLRLERGLRLLLPDPQPVADLLPQAGHAASVRPSRRRFQGPDRTPGTLSRHGVPRRDRSLMDRGPCPDPRDRLTPAT